MLKSSTPWGGSRCDFSSIRKERGYSRSTRRQVVASTSLSSANGKINRGQKSAPVVGWPLPAFKNTLAMAYSFSHRTQRERRSTKLFWDSITSPERGERTPNPSGEGRRYLE